MKKNHNSSIFIEKEIREIRVIRGAPVGSIRCYPPIWVVPSKF